MCNKSNVIGLLLLLALLVALALVISGCPDKLFPKPTPAPAPVVVPVPEPVKPPCPCPGPCKPDPKPDPKPSPRPPCCGPVKVLAFTAEWCKPCQNAKPELLRAIKAGLRVDIIDIDKEPNTMRLYGITSVPTFMITVGDKITMTHDVSKVTALLN